MGYALGIDLGTTFSAAAIAEDGRTEIVQLGTRQATIPSVVLLREDGEVLVGEAAERRAVAEPGRVAREFKRRLGDPTPLILGGTPYGAEALMSYLLRSVVESVRQQKGETPELIAITHPATYGPYKLDLLRQAANQADIGPVTFVAEPEAAAVHYAEQERVPVSAAVAVYDFGGGTFDAAIVRRTESGWTLLGDGEGLERLGGIDFDEAVFAHVRRLLDGKLEELPSDSPGAITAVSRLRSDCVQAKESLSEDTETTIPVLLPNVQTDVRLTRAEFEAIVRPRIRETIAALERAVRSAGLRMQDIDRILLVGGSSRIPLVAQMVREATGRPIAVDAQPKHAIALGAASIAARESTEATVETPPLASAVPGGASDVEAPVEAAPRPSSDMPPESRPFASEEPPAVGQAPPRAPATAGWSRSTLFALVGIPIVAVAIAIGAFALLSRSDSAEPADPGTPATETAAPDLTRTAAAGVAVTSTPAPTVVQPTATPTLPPQSAAIAGITTANGRYVVEFTVRGFEPDINDVHVHFFFNTVSPEDAGVPGQGPWIIYDTPSPFTGYAESDRPTGANQMCILVANADHSIRLGTGNCWQLP